MDADVTFPMGDGTACEIRLPDMIVTSTLAGEGVQPWSEKSCYEFRVRVSAKGGEFTESAYGSQHDFEIGDNAKAEEMAWMILSDLWDAWNDPEEFFSMALGEPDQIDLQRVRGILSVIDYAEKIGSVLDLNGGEIAEARERA